MSNAREILIEQAEERGFSFPTWDASEAEMPDLPPDVTVISSNAVMNLMQRFSSLIAYTVTEEALSKAEADAAAGAYRQQKSQKWIELRDSPKKLTNGEIDAYMDFDEDLVALRKRKIVAESYANLVASLKKGYEQKYQLLSREVTRRGISAERHFD